MNAMTVGGRLSTCCCASSFSPRSRRRRLAPPTRRMRLRVALAAGRQRRAVAAGRAATGDLRRCGASRPARPARAQRGARDGAHTRSCRRPVRCRRRRANRCRCSRCASTCASVDRRRDAACRAPRGRHARWPSRRGNHALRATPASPGYVADATALDAPVSALVVAVDGGDSVDVRVRIEASDDLAAWQVVADATPHRPPGGCGPHARTGSRSVRAAQGPVFQDQRRSTARRCRRSRASARKPVSPRAEPTVRLAPCGRRRRRARKGVRAPSCTTPERRCPRRGSTSCCPWPTAWCRSPCRHARVPRMNGVPWRAASRTGSATARASCAAPQSRSTARRTGTGRSYRTRAPVLSRAEARRWAGCRRRSCFPRAAKARSSSTTVASMRRPARCPSIRCCRKPAMRDWSKARRWCPRWPRRCR